MADSRLTQCNLTALDYGRRIGRHENRSSTLTENRSSQVHGDSDISSEGEFGMLKSWRKASFDPKEPFELRVGIPGKFQIAALDRRTGIDST